MEEFKEDSDMVRPAEEADDAMGRSEKQGGQTDGFGNQSEIRVAHGQG